MHKLLPRCCLSILVLFAPCAWPATLRLVGDLWSPYVDASLPGGGVATRVVTAALARAGYATSVEQVPWARAVQGVSEGRYDVLLTVWFNDERARIGEHSAGYLSNRVLFWRKRGSGIEFNRDLASLRGYAIATARASAYSPAFTQDQTLQKVAVRDFAMAVGMLAIGRVALAVEEERAARYVLAQQPAATRELIEPLATPLAEPDLRILVSLKNPEHAQIVQAFDRAIAAMKADGSLNALLDDGQAAYPAPPRPPF